MLQFMQKYAKVLIWWPFDRRSETNLEVTLRFKIARILHRSFHNTKILPFLQVNHRFKVSLIRTFDTNIFVASGYPNAH
jgi:hypothetical protein